MREILFRVKNDEGIDNIDWLVNLCDIYKVVKVAYESEAD